MQSGRMQGIRVTHGQRAKLQRCKVADEVIALFRHRIQIKFLQRKIAQLESSTISFVPPWPLGVCSRRTCSNRTQGALQARLARSIGKAGPLTHCARDGGTEERRNVRSLFLSMRNQPEIQKSSETQPGICSRHSHARCSNIDGSLVANPAMACLKLHLGMNSRPASIIRPSFDPLPLGGYPAFDRSKRDA